MRIYDIRDSTANVDGVILVGGFVGELIITFTCMLDYILSSPAHQNFIFSTDMLETFLKDLLGGEDCPYPDGICTLSLAKPISELDCGDHYDAISKAAREADNMTDFGLKFLFEIQKDLVLSQEVIEVVYKAIAKIATQKPTPAQEIAAIPDDATEAVSYTHLRAHET